MYNQISNVPNFHFFLSNIHSEFFARTMLLNSTVWTCAYTSRPNLTYAEALDSERHARRTLSNLDKTIKTALTYLTTLTKRTCISDIVEDVFSFLSVRYMKNESISVQNLAESKVWHPATIISVIGLANPLSPIEPSKIKYEVKRTNNGQIFVADALNVRRLRHALTRDYAKLFLKQIVQLDSQGQMIVKSDVYRQYVTDENVKKFTDLFVGKIPSFEMSKHLAKKLEKQAEVQSTKKKSPTAAAAGKTNGTKKPKQQSISNYFSKNDNQTPTKDKAAKQASAAAKEKASREEAKQLAEKMLQMKLAREQEIEQKKKLAEEQLRQRIEFQNSVERKLRELNQIRDDLELVDHRPIPSGRSVSTLIKDRYFSDGIAVLEFVKSFLLILEAKDKFPQSINFMMLERSLIHREVAGPLTDIIQVLLGSVFSQQVHEASEVFVDYVDPDTIQPTTAVQHAVRLATRTTSWAQKYLSMDLNELPMDAMTLSELLRIHLLMSGAKTDDHVQSWRMSNRGGYQHIDDPGLDLRVRKPHIVRALGSSTVYQLPIKDILAILHCLVNQVLSYSAVRNTLDERIETAHKSRVEMRLLCQTERKRENILISTKKRFNDEMRVKLNEFVGSPREKEMFASKLQAETEQSTKRLDADAERAKLTFTKAYQAAKENLFAYQLYLGSDRAFRTYWLFESLPGLFIMHKPIKGRCLDEPIYTIPGLAECAMSDRRKFVQQMLLDEQKANDKENKLMNPLDLLKPVSKRKIRGPDGKPITVTPGDDAIQLFDRDRQPLAPRDLLMCTGLNAAKECPVHSPSNPNTAHWSFICTAEELAALINSLNPRGVREKALREQLENESELILNHIESCPVELLQIDDTNRADATQNLLNIKQYLKGNLNYEPGMDINVIMEETFVTNLLELELNLNIGHLGTLKVNDRDAWRDALYSLTFDMQCDYIEWGPGGQFHKGM